MPTPIQQARWANRIMRDCLLETDDPNLALQAADIILSTQPFPDETEIDKPGDEADEDWREEAEPIGTNDGKPVDLGPYFSFDIFNRQAQGILNRSLIAAKGLTAAARRDLSAALKGGPAKSGEAILKFIDKYRLQLAKLLTTTQLASLLEGAKEVAAKVPTLATFPGAVPLPPSLEPKEAVALINRLDRLTVEARALEIYELPPDQQVYAQQAIAAKQAGGGIGPPRFIPPAPPSGAPEGIHFPTIDEAVKQLAERNVITREGFDALDSAARAKAFTVAGVDAEDTLVKIRDLLAENVEKGADYETFKQKVLSAVDEGTFMSEGHLENVFRTNIQTSFSDGQATVLNHPMVRSGFPYATYNSIHDSRRRPNHGLLEKLGIEGTNIYRINDPVFQTFRPPWDYMDRCGWNPITVRYAAEKGIAEAKEWLDTGVEPSPPAFVPMPSFSPPPGFRRAVASAPLSIQLSLQPLAAFAFNPSEPRDASGEWTAGGAKKAKPKVAKQKARYKPSVRIKPASARVFTGKPIATKVRLTKQEAGKLGEDIVIAHLQENGLADARPMNLDRNNYPIDLIQDHETIEAKTGQVSNSAGAQQWRLTIGEPGKAEKALLAQMTSEEKLEHNRKKQQAIHTRKDAAIKDIENMLGRKVKRKTYTVILNPDTNTADIFSFDGHHDRIGWNSEMMRSGYVRTVKYG